MYSTPDILNLITLFDIFKNKVKNWGLLKIDLLRLFLQKDISINSIKHLTTKFTKINQRSQSLDFVVFLVVVLCVLVSLQN